MNIIITDITGEQFTFESPKELLDFSKKQIEFWQKKQSEISNIDSLTRNFNSGHGQWQNVYNAIKGWKDSVKNWSDVDTDTNVQHLTQNFTRHLQNNWLWREHSFLNDAFTAFDESPNTGQAFLEAIVKNQSGSPTNFDMLKGYLMAYEFQMQDESKIVTRRNSEKRTIHSLKKGLFKEKQDLSSEIEQLKTDFNEWKNNTSESHDSWENKLKESTLRWRRRSNHTNIRQRKGWNQKLENLESAFREHMRLEGPSKYWNKSAKKFHTQGWAYLVLLVAAIAVGILWLSVYFLSWLNGLETPLKLNTLQGFIIFASIGTMYGYLVRTLGKLSFSSFHLMRDSEEREQLTHLYMSLINENAVDDDTRNIVLQALFSRSETGLLGTDSSPVMPNAGDLLKAVGSISKAK